MKYEMLLTTPDDVEYMSEKLDAFYDSIVPPSERPSTEGYVLKVSDENGNIIGGCIAYVNSWDILRINTLWVDEHHRKCGLGSKLLEEIEHVGREKGCYLSTLGTGDFQARGFYEKNGYQVCGTVENSPKGHVSYSMAKRLDCPILGTVSNHDDGKLHTTTFGTEEDGDFIDDKLDEYNCSHATLPNRYERFGKKFVDEHGNLVAGIFVRADIYRTANGTDVWGAANVSVLWVEERYRNERFGSQLLLDIERTAKENSGDFILLDVLDCQATIFLKHGYRIVGEIQNCPRGHRWYTMKKLLE